MSDHIPESRHLPAEHARRLAELEGGPKTFDGRSRKWAERLAETEFVAVEIVEEKKKTIIKASLTDRGKYALERDKRGVDPYLRMTA